MRLPLILPFLLFPATAQAAQETAIFAGGCFWSMEGAFDDVPGVMSAVSGYTGGTVANPTYGQVSAGDTGHVEAVKIVYDPDKTTYDKLLAVYWHNVDPFNATGQFCDNGPEYRTEIFTTSAAQEKAAHASMDNVETRLKRKPVTKIMPAAVFYPAEDYHQHYEKKNPAQYAAYRLGCGRDRTTESIWGKQ
jgi:peptide-methionine (S)-S-oxide reductase